MIRLADLEDAKEIAKIHVQTWQVAYAGIVPNEHLENLSMSNVTARWQKRLAKSPKATWVAQKKEELVGWVIFGPGRDEDAQGWGEVYAIYVHPNHWRLGFGKRLIKKAEHRLREEGFKGLTLWVLEENGQAQKFYANAGFSLDGLRKQINIGGKDLWELRYAKSFEV